MKAARIDLSGFKKVRRAVRDANIRALGDAGAVIRDSAKASMPQRAGNSPPGSPPSMLKTFFPRLVRTGVDRSVPSSVAGPTSAARTAGAAAFMRSLEFGGPLPATIARPKRKSGRDAQGRFRAGSNGTGKRVPRLVKTVEARPFMGPALEREQSKIPRFWANSLRGG